MIWIAVTRKILATTRTQNIFRPWKWIDFRDNFGFWDSLQVGFGEMVVNSGCSMWVTRKHPMVAYKWKTIGFPEKEQN